MAKTKRLPDPEPGTFGARIATQGEGEGVDILRLLEKMAGGDKKAATEVVAFLRRHPDAADIILAHVSTTESSWLDYATGDLFTRFSMEERTRKLRQELLGDSPTPLERLLVERIAICALQVQIAETQYIGVMKGSTTFTKAMFYDDLQDRAQRRYLAAIKALAQVRRLQLPAVAQLNVATNQVNMASAPTGSSPGVPVQRTPAGLSDAGALTVDDVLTGRDVEQVVQEDSRAADERLER